VSDVELEVVDDPALVCAERLAAQARAGGSIVLTGGSAPKLAYEIAAELEPDWSRVDVWWGDDRCVPPDDELSNYGMAKETLLDRLTVAPRSVHRMESVEQYERELSGVGTFDLVLLGLGPDGHVASLFPNFPTLDVTDRDVVGTPAGLQPFVDRITLTLPRLRNTRELLFLVTGADKADAVARAFAADPSRETPGSLVRADYGPTRAILDSASSAIAVSGTGTSSK
jgi:6-phosphogluconolactonase